MQFSTFFSFHIHYQADFGQTVVVVGDHPEFGAWDASKGIVLDWNEVFIKKLIKVLKFRRVTFGPEQKKFPGKKMTEFLPSNTNMWFVREKILS